MDNIVGKYLYNLRKLLNLSQIIKVTPEITCNTYLAYIGSLRDIFNINKSEPIKEISHEIIIG